MKLLPALLALAAPLAAGRIDVTGRTALELHTGATLLAFVEAPYPAAQYQNLSPNPDQTVWMSGVGRAITDRDPRLLPHTSAGYYPGYLVQVWLESSDGAASYPFHDGWLEDLGYAPGQELITTASVNSLDRSGFSAELWLTEEISGAVFHQTRPGTIGARIRIRNLGEPFTLELLPGHPVGSAIAAGWGFTSEDGSLRYSPGAQTYRVMLENPEPASWLLAGLGLAAAFAAIRRRQAARGRPGAR